MIKWFKGLRGPVWFALGFLVFLCLGVAANYNYTVRIVDSAGTVLDNGVASATTASYQGTFRVVNSSGLVLDTLGANSTIYPNTAPTAGQIPVGNAGNTAYAPVSPSGDVVSISSAGAFVLGLDATHITTNTVPAARLPSAPSIFDFFITATNLGTTNASITYFAMGGSATEVNVSINTPVTMVLSNEFCSINTAPGASNSYDFALIDNTNPTGITCNTGNSQRCSDITHTYTATASTSLLSIKATTNVGGGAPTATTARCTFKITTSF